MGLALPFFKLGGGVALATSAIFLNAPAFASTLIDVQFQSINAQTGAAVIGSASDQWNMVASRTTTGSIGPVSGSVNLRTSTNSQSGITLNYSGQDGYTSPVGTYTAPSGAANLMQGYLVTHSIGAIILTLSGFDPAQQFDLYLIMQGDMYTKGRRNDVTVNGVTQSAVNSNAGAFILNDNYLHFQGTADAAGKIAITNVAGTNLIGASEADINGFQLSFTAVPEPQSWVMLISGFAVVGAAMRRRRARTTGTPQLV